MSLIQTLNENADKTPDEIAEIVGDPLARPITLRAFGKDRYANTDDRRVIWLHHERDGTYSIDSDTVRGEFIDCETVTSWFPESNPEYSGNLNWSLVSVEAYAKHPELCERWRD